ncbi:MAG: DNA-binding protein [Candidatus Bathyarchaeia archaeon]
MSDSELERLKRQRLAEMQRMLDAKKQENQPKEKPTTEQILQRVFVGRAWEVYEATRNQYPSIAGRLFAELAQLVQTGQLTGQITGEQLYGLIRQIGLDVRLDTKIQVLDHGKLKSLGDKIRGG